MNNTNLEMGDILFIKNSKNKTLYEMISHYLIKKVTHSNYYHVVYYFHDNKIFECDGFKEAGFSEMSDDVEYDVKRLNLPKETRIKIMKEMIATSGSLYSWGEIISLFFRKQFGIQVFYDDPKRFICSSELMEATYKVIGIHLVDQTTTDISPQDLWESSYLIDVK